MARYQAVRRLVLKANGWSICATTHEAQAPPAVAVNTAQEFVASMIPLLSTEERDKQWIMNMDQTAVFSYMAPRTTINQSGVHTVSVRKGSGSDIRFTVAISVTTSGEIMKPFIVMKDE